jgi:hypothetical protein
VNLESQILGIERENDIPGHLIPQVYFRYVRTRNAQGIGNILSHNRQDIETLARLTLRIGEIFSGQGSEELPPVDLFSAGRYAYTGRTGPGCPLNEAAPARLPEDREVEAKKAKAARLKELKKYSEAAELWRTLQATEFPRCPRGAAIIEHRKGDLKEALNLSEQALAQAQDRSTIKKWEHRRARVATKLARRKPAGTGLLFHAQN